MLLCKRLGKCKSRKSEVAKTFGESLNPILMDPSARSNKFNTDGSFSEGFFGRMGMGRGSKE
jgi:hypothetical protein